VSACRISYRTFAATLADLREVHDSTEFINSAIPQGLWDTLADHLVAAEHFAAAFENEANTKEPA